MSEKEERHPWVFLVDYLGQSADIPHHAVPAIFAGDAGFLRCACRLPVSAVVVGID